MQNYVDTIISDFHTVSMTRCESDAALMCRRCTTRKDLPMVTEVSQGVVYLRDDAVNALINRIRALESQITAEAQ